MSNNPLSAANQQERLIKIGWVIGFVDGEGCFSIGFVRQGDRPNRKGYKTGYQVNHKFCVTQGAKSLSCLAEIQEFFGIGQIYKNRRHDNHKEDLYNYHVQREEDLLHVIIPFFRRNHMHSAKQQDFEKFAACVELMSEGAHKTIDGLVKIAMIAQTMNRQKPREAFMSILRDYTPKIHDSGS